MIEPGWEETIDISSFSDGQIKSKLWLLNNIEPYIKERSKILIIGGWYGILSFMLFTKFNNRIHSISNIDINDEHLRLSLRFNNSFQIDGRYFIINQDVNTFTNYEKYDLIINTSCEHIDDIWYHNVPKNKLCILQSNNFKLETHINNVSSLEDMISKYYLSNLFFSDKISFIYPDKSFDRFMLIGKK